MKKEVALRIKALVNQAAKEKGLEPTKKMFRGVKKWYLKKDGETRRQMRDGY